MPRNSHILVAGSDGTIKIDDDTITDAVMLAEQGADSNLLTIKYATTFNDNVIHSGTVTNTGDVVNSGALTVTGLTTCDSNVNMNGNNNTVDGRIVFNNQYIATNDLWVGTIDNNVIDSNDLASTSSIYTDGLSLNINCQTDVAFAYTKINMLGGATQINNSLHYGYCVLPINDTNEINGNIIYNSDSNISYYNSSGWNPLAKTADHYTKTESDNKYPLITNIGSSLGNGLTLNSSVLDLDISGSLLIADTNGVYVSLTPTFTTLTTTGASTLKTTSVESALTIKNTDTNSTSFAQLIFDGAFAGFNWIHRTNGNNYEMYMNDTNSLVYYIEPDGTNLFNINKNLHIVGNISTSDSNSSFNNELTTTNNAVNTFNSNVNFNNSVLTFDTNSSLSSTIIESSLTIKNTDTNATSYGKLILQGGNNTNTYSLQTNGNNLNLYANDTNDLVLYTEQSGGTELFSINRNLHITKSITTSDSNYTLTNNLTSTHNAINTFEANTTFNADLISTQQLRITTGSVLDIEGTGVLRVYGNLYCHLDADAVFTLPPQTSAGASVDGAIRYNSDSNVIEMYYSSGWNTVGASTSYTADDNGITLSGTEFQLALNGSTLSKDSNGLKVNPALTLTSLSCPSLTSSIALTINKTIQLSDPNLFQIPLILGRVSGSTPAAGDFSSSSGIYNFGSDLLIDNLPANGDVRINTTCTGSTTLIGSDSNSTTTISGVAYINKIAPNGGTLTLNNITGSTTTMGFPDSNSTNYIYGKTYPSIMIFDSNDPSVELQIPTNSTSTRRAAIHYDTNTSSLQVYDGGWNSIGGSSVIYGHIAGCVPIYVSTTGFKMSSGVLNCADKMFTVATSGTISPTLSGGGVFYVYFDYSAGDTNYYAKNATDTNNVPAWNDTYQGWYHQTDTNDRAVGYFYSQNDTTSILRFQSYGEGREMKCIHETQCDNSAFQASSSSGAWTAYTGIGGAKEGAWFKVARFATIIHCNMYVNRLSNGNCNVSWSSDSNTASRYWSCFVSNIEPMTSTESRILTAEIKLKYDKYTDVRNSCCYWQTNDGNTTTAFNPMGISYVR